MSHLRAGEDGIIHALSERAHFSLTLLWRGGERGGRSHKSGHLFAKKKSA